MSLKSLWSFCIKANRERRKRALDRANALKCLHGIENVKGKTDPRLIRKADEYAQQVLGSLVYAPWLYVYCAVSNTFKEGWIPCNYYRREVLPRFKGHYGNYSTLKTLSRKIFKHNAFPDSAYYVNGLFFDRDYRVLRENKLLDKLFKNGDKTIFKQDGSGRGTGVHVFSRSEFCPRQIRALGGGVFQDYIEQHSVLEEIVPSCVATLRVTTVLDDQGRYSARSSVLRVGRLGQQHLVSSKNIMIPIDLSSGSFGPLGYPEVWVGEPTHPDTGFEYAGKQFPRFENCLELALCLHRKMPYARCIGWDMTVDREGRVQVLEWNGGWNGISFGEAVKGPNYADLGWEKSHLMPGKELRALF